ncbi:MAG: biotin-dependent carboxyltransferase family protein [Hyphomicrobiaceae bacterium]
MTGYLRVIAAGLGTSVQDAGRFGFQRFGVPTAGALDRVAMAAANTIVGNAPGAAVLEMLYLGATLEVVAESARVACVGLGASLEVTLEDGTRRDVPGAESVRVGRGARLRVIVGRSAISCVLAIEGGIALPEVMGSLSTHARAGIGGFEGRVLAAGDLLPIARESVEERPELRLPDLDLAVPPRIRVVLGPQDDYFTDKAVATFLSEPYEVTRAADRMGMRLTGKPLAHAKGFNIVSDGIAAGSIQVPGDGQPIILLADRQTTGGYPKIATVASVDLPALGRVGPGAKLQFEAISVEAAEDLRRAQAESEARWREHVEPASPSGSPEASSLYEANLISGVADAWMED